MPTRRRALALTFAALLLAFAGPVRAQIALDRLIVELPGRAGATADVEVRNEGDETAYVLVEPSEVVAPGTPEERRRASPDPEALGLLAAPSRLVLEPGARRIVRLARLDEPGSDQRVWRVGIRPVTGATTAETSALQVLVGYGVLVLGRPEAPRADVRAERRGATLVLVNDGNADALLFGGRHCDGAGERCVELPTRRLYPGNRWRLDLRWETPAVFNVESPSGVRERRF
jgi:P pilus assembly chaperone PapD